jgi:hypothetical protein
VAPRLFPDYQWPQLLQLAAADPRDLAVGIDVGTALEIAGGVATARGSSAAGVVDGRAANFRTGSNGSLSAH